jgi:chromosome transmission fidelity protein 18
VSLSSFFPRQPILTVTRITQVSQPGAEPNMWVDRYKPTKFMDLVGEERVHREIMAWVKEWDVCVFNRRRPKGLKRPKHKFFGADREAKKNDDEYGRPYEKVISPGDV